MLPATTAARMTRKRVNISGYIKKSRMPNSGMATTLSTALSAAAVPAPGRTWRTVRTGCCDVHFHEEVRAQSERVAAMADESVALVSALLVLSLIDLEHQLLPNAITLPGIVLGLAASFLPGASIGTVMLLLLMVYFIAFIKISERGSTAR